MDTSRREALDLLRKSVARGVDEQNLPDNPLLKDVIRRLLAEQAVYLGVMDKGDSIKLLHVVQSELSQALQKVGDCCQQIDLSTSVTNELSAFVFTLKYS